jgi:hypothetical protein
MEPQNIAGGERITALFSHPTIKPKAVGSSAYDRLPSFQRALRPSGKNSSTVASYSESVRLFYDYARAMGMPASSGEVRREHVDWFYVYPQTSPNSRTGAPVKPSTAARHHKGLRHCVRRTGRTLRWRGVPYFRPGNKATHRQTAKIVAATFLPECEGCAPGVDRILGRRGADVPMFRRSVQLEARGFEHVVG